MYPPGTFFPKASFIPAVLPVDLLIFLASSELHLLRIDDDDVIAGVDERRVGRLVFALEQPRRHGCDATEHLPVGIDDVPAAAGSCRLSAGHERRHP